jgi:ribosomal protein S18 acetylase RimI-like enzyme
VPWVGLGVAHSNHVAQRGYRDTAFTERARFSRYGLPED